LHRVPNCALCEHPGGKCMTKARCPSWAQHTCKRPQERFAHMSSYKSISRLHFYLPPIGADGIADSPGGATAVGEARPFSSGIGATTTRSSFNCASLRERLRSHGRGESSFSCRAIMLAFSHTLRGHGRTGSAWRRNRHSRRLAPMLLKRACEGLSSDLGGKLIGRKSLPGSGSISVQPFFTRISNLSTGPGRRITHPSGIFSPARDRPQFVE